MKSNLVILHGWASHQKNWQPFIKILKNLGANVYQPAMPGFLENIIDVPHSTADYVNWLKQFLKKNRINKPTLIGHSFGGQVAINFTVKNPSKVNRLILINSAGIRNQLNIKKLFFLVLAKTGKVVFSLPLLNNLFSIAQRFLYKAAHEGDYYQASPVMKETLKIINKEDQTKHLKSIDTPTLILWGEKDTITPLKDGEKIHQLMPNSKLVIYPNTTHGLPFQAPKKIANKILWFIS